MGLWLYLQLLSLHPPYLAAWARPWLDKLSSSVVCLSAGMKGTQLSQWDNSPPRDTLHSPVTFYHRCLLRADPQAVVPCRSSLAQSLASVNCFSLGTQTQCKSCHIYLQVTQTDPSLSLGRLSSAWELLRHLVDTVYMSVKVLQIHQRFFYFVKTLPHQRAPQTTIAPSCLEALTASISSFNRWQTEARHHTLILLIPSCPSCLSLLYGPLWSSSP